MQKQILKQGLLDLRPVLDGQGYIGLLNVSGNELTIANAARVSFNKNKTEFDEKDKKLLIRLLKDRHTSPFEHCHFTFIVHCPLAVRSQWMRHRTWSYSELSRRYSSEDIQFFRRDRFRKQSPNNKQCSTDEIIDDPELVMEAEKLLVESERVYNKLINAGVSREEARDYLAIALFTTFQATVNLHNLIHFLSLRDADDAQKEIQEYAIAIKLMLAPRFPVIAEYFNWG